MQIGSLLKSFSLYTFSNIFGAAAGFLLLPILTAYLTPEEYGTLGLFNTYAQLLLPLIGLAASGLISIEYFNSDLNKRQYKSLFSSISFIPFIPFTFFLLTSLFFSDNLEKILIIPSEVIWVIPFFTVINLYYQQFLEYLIIRKEAKYYVFLNLSKIVMEYGLAILFVVILGYGWIGRISSTFVVLFGAFLISIFFYKKWDLITLDIKRIYVKQGVVYGLPLIGHVIGKYVINQSDKLFIANMVSKSELGIYNSGYMVGTTMLILSGAFIKVYTPYVYERFQASTEKGKIEIVRLSYAFFGIIFIFLIFLGLISKFLFAEIIDPNYFQGYKFVFWTGLSYAFWGGYLIFSSSLHFFKETRILFYLSIVNILLNLVLNYFLITKFHTIGASYATCISFLVLLALVAIIANKKYPLPWFSFKDIFLKQ
ncbi:MAG: polysaccharide biosynthesis C-terminal domain-containing protein [Ekhidna sp.]